VQDRDGGSRLEVELLRPISWLTAYGLTGAGDLADLNLPEMGAEGVFRVVSVGSAPRVEPGSGRMVTGLFRHPAGVVYDLVVGREVMGVTAGHPVWSVDRGGWVVARELLPGERLLGWAAGAVVTGIRARGVEPVYNLEVEGDHCYRVGEHGILVHNQSQPPAWAERAAHWQVTPQAVLWLNNNPLLLNCNDPEQTVRAIPDARIGHALPAAMVTIVKETQAILPLPPVPGGSEPGSDVGPLFFQSAYHIPGYVIKQGAADRRAAFLAATVAGRQPAIATSDDAGVGHVIANSLGGPGQTTTLPTREKIVPPNLFPSTRRFETQFTQMFEGRTERGRSGIDTWHGALNTGNKVAVRIAFEFNTPGHPYRPSKAIVEWWRQCLFTGYWDHFDPQEIRNDP
jgi:hypothetical protein